MSEPSFLNKFTPYKKALPAGVLLPEVKIDERLYKKFNCSPTLSNYDFLRQLCLHGVKELGLDKLPNKQAYYDRLKRELEMFKELGFTDYILLTWDVLHYCKEQNIPIGAGRGSACGCAVLYCIGVTNVDPIKYDLYFERFVSKARARKFEEDGVTYLDGSLMVDVDNDIAYEDRQRVIDYLYSKYPNKVAAIMTFTTLSGKLCIKECIKLVDEQSEDVANQVSDFIPKLFGKVLSFDKAIEQSEKFKKWSEEHSETLGIARHLEGLIKNSSVHPSGIALSNGNMNELAPTGLLDGTHPIAGFDMDSVSELMVKIDILGLRTLSVVHNCCKMLNIDWKKIDPEDQSIYAALTDLKHPKGLFQIEADTNYEVCRKIKPKSINELSDVLALARPGALAFVDEYVAVKSGSKGIEQRLPELDKILKETKGIFIYQESLMRVASEVFGLTLEDAEAIRRACGKKKREEMAKWESRIYEQAKLRKLDLSVADFYWKALNDSADYSFNRCLSPDSLVYLKGYKATRLRDVKIGDFILGYNTLTGTNKYIEVLNVYSSKAKLYEVLLESGKSITCSMEHKILSYSPDIETIEMRTLSDIIKLNLCVACESDKPHAPHIVWESVLSAKALGEKDSIDLEVDGRDHNFYCNRVVVSNSHSIAYATLAATTIFLKFNHPREFFTSLLNMSRFEANSHEEIRIIASELQYFGIKLLPPDLGLSKMDFAIEEGNIRYGLSSIKGVAAKSLEALESFRGKKKPNKFEVFQAAKQAGINIGILSALLQAGTLEGYQQKRSRTVLEAQAWNTLTDREKRNFLALGEKYNYNLVDCIKKSVESEAIADDGKKIMPAKRYETFKRKIEKYQQIYVQNSKYELFANWYFENQLLGYCSNLKLKDILGEDLCDSSDLPYMEGFSKKKFVGTVTESKKAKSKAGNTYIRLEIVDESGKYSAMICDSPKQNKCSDFIASGKQIPEKGDIVTILGSKARDGDTIFAEDMSVMSQTIYMKLADLGRDEPEKSENLPIT